MRARELNAEQSIAWPGGLADGLAIGDLPALMERLHFRVVAAYAPALRVRQDGRDVACRLPGGVTALGFAWERDDVGERSAERWWRLGGALVRGGRGGRFGLGIEPGGTTRAWVRVEDFPAVFLATGLPGAVGVAYEAFHAHASHAYLRLLRAQLAR